MKRKVIIGFIVVLLLTMSGVGVLCLKNQNTLKLKETIFTFELGEKVSFKPEDYLLDSVSEDIVKGSEIKLKNLYSIDISNDELKTEGLEYLSVGEYEVSISYKNKSVSFEIKVEDTVSPTFVDFKEEIVLEQDSLNVDLTNFYEASDLTDVTIVIESDYDLSKVGEYEIIVNASDKYNNITSNKSTLRIIKYEDIKDNELTMDNEGNIYKSQKRIDEENKPKEQSNSNSNNSSSGNSQTTKKPSTNSNTNTSTNNQNNPANNVSVATYRRDIASQYVQRINAYRVENGLSELPVTSEAQNEADMRAKQIVDNYGHNSSYGFGENIGKNVVGFDFVDAWKNSWSHKNAMLREQNTAIAVSIYEVDGWWYAVTSFRMNY